VSDGLEEISPSANRIEGLRLQLVIVELHRERGSGAWERSSFSLVKCLLAYGVEALDQRRRRALGHLQ
jgi:hypothetical protein